MSSRDPEYPWIYRGVNAFFGRVKMGRVKDGTHLSSILS